MMTDIRVEVPQAGYPRFHGLYVNAFYIALRDMPLSLACFIILLLPFLEYHPFTPLFRFINTSPAAMCNFTQNSLRLP